MRGGDRWWLPSPLGRGGSPEHAELMRRLRHTAPGYTPPSFMGFLCPIIPFLVPPPPSWTSRGLCTVCVRWGGEVGQDSGREQAQACHHVLLDLEPMSLL